jgi:Flp pilus assembly protein TadD
MALLLSACAQTVVRQPPAANLPPYRPEPQTQKSVPKPVPKLPRGDSSAPPTHPASKAEAPTASPVVTALLREAESNRDSGRLDNAAASLERALRIQPRNPKLWSRLAEIRLQQGQPGLAEDLAKKSNLLAKGDAELIRGNWSVIAQARRRKGDAEGAADAEERANQ